MNAKITLVELTQLMAESTSTTKRVCELFLRELFATISQALIEGESVKIKGIGTFKVTEVKPRKSVSVQSGKSIEVKGYSRITFTPTKALAAAVNQPFEQFETVYLHDEVSDEKLAEIDERYPSILPEDTVLNRAEFARVFLNVSSFISKHLEGQLISDDPRKPFDPLEADLSAFRALNRPVSLSALVNNINSLFDPGSMKPLDFRQVRSWAIRSGLLEKTEYNGKSRWTATKAGENIGISCVCRTYNDEDCLVTLYDKNAQQYIADNLPSIIAV